MQETSVELIKKRLLNSRNDIFLKENLSNIELTYEQTLNAALNFKDILHNEGIKSGDRVVITGENSLEFAIIYFGCLFAGACTIPVHPHSTKSHLEYVKDTARPKLFISINNPPLQKEINSISKNNTLEIGKDFHETIYQVHSTERYEDRIVKACNSLNEEQELLIIYTSGTTAEPKGVVRRLKELLINGSLFCQEVRISKKHRFINYLPMTYLGGYYNLLLIPFLSGGSTVITEPFNPKIASQFWEMMNRNNINTIWFVPTIMSILLEIDRTNDGNNYCKNHLDLALVGMAPLPQSLEYRFKLKYGVTLLENYGLSETLFITTRKANSNSPQNGVGSLLSGVSIRFVDAEGNQLSNGEEGEIEVQTPFLMEGYIHDLNTNFSTLEKDSWFKTGDIGTMNSEGQVKITGRIKDLIIKGGINISPSAIENTIYKNKKISECAVVGVPHLISGEDIVAVIKLNEGENWAVVRNEIMALLKSDLSPTQRPAKLILINDFPKTTSGKIIKTKVKHWAIESYHSKENSIQHSIESTQNNPTKISSLISDSIQALSIYYNNKVYELKEEGKDIIVLSLGEAFFDVPLQSFENLPFPDIYHYCHSRGLPKLRKKLSDYFAKEYLVEFDPAKEILITAGSKIAIYISLLTAINEGDEVIIHEPAWVSYVEQVKYCKGIPVSIPYYESVYTFENYISPKTKVVIINNPNNPSGYVYGLSDLAHLYALAKKYGFVIISDEAYSDFLPEKDSFISMANIDIKKTHSVIINSISKNYGISGWRIGYLIANSNFIEESLKLNQHLITCAPTILQHYLVEYFDEIIKITKPQIKLLLELRLRLMNYMDQIGLKYLKGSATFYFFISINDGRLNSMEFCDKLLLEHSICAVPGIGYGHSCDKYIRVSIGAETQERIEFALNKIKFLIDNKEKNPNLVVNA